MDAVVSAANSAGQALRDQLSGGTEAAGESLETLKGKSEEASAGLSEFFSEIRESIEHVAEAFAIFEGVDYLKEKVSGAMEFGESMQKLSI